MELDGIFICARMADVSADDVAPGSIPGSCRKCGQAVWRSPSSLRATGRIDYQCVVCVVADPSLDPDTFELRDATYAELVRLLGLRPRESYRHMMVEWIRRQRSPRFGSDDVPMA